MCTEHTNSFRRFACLYVDGEHAVEVQGACLMLLMGIWLWFNDTFQVSDVYKIMSSIGNEKTWSIVFILIAAIQLLSIFFDKVHWQYKNYIWCAIDAVWIRKHILLIKGAIWFTLFMGVISGDARALSAPIFFIFAFNAFRAFFCVKYIRTEKTFTNLSGA